VAVLGGERSPVDQRATSCPPLLPAVLTLPLWGGVAVKVTVAALRFSLATLLACDTAAMRAASGGSLSHALAQLGTNDA
jgi:hypothetical protein